MFLKEQSKKDYIRLHRQIPTDVAQAIHRANIRNYSIFLREPENLLFSYWEYLGGDFSSDRELMFNDPAMKRIWQLTDGMQFSLATNTSSTEIWASMREVFHND
ncbi:MAG: L-rhamnose mutarotase [Rhodobacteraceae bacterium]|nr:L-rhamnose mutarotase [Paracoccaceae bacterium]